jgi:hypothetical protein
VAAAALAAPPRPATFATLPEKEGCQEIYLQKKVQVPEGKVLRAWTATSAAHEFVLYVNGKEACRSRYGRVASAFRLAEEIEDLAPFFKPGTNTLAMKARRWSTGAPAACLRAEIQVQIGKTVIAVPLVTDDSWVGFYEAPPNWTAADFKAKDWMQVKTIQGNRLPPRIRRDQQGAIEPRLPPPLPKPALDALPQMADMSDWQQAVVSRDVEAETKRLMGIFNTEFVARTYAEAIQRGNTHMGDSFSITGYPVGNGWVWTAIGPYPFYNTTATLGPEYQYPVQWNPGSTFAGDAVSLLADGKPLVLENQWMWKIRRTDVVVAAAAGADRRIVFYALTFAPPGLKALLRLYAVANGSDAPLTGVLVTNTIPRTKAAGKTLTETVKHAPIADAAGDANTRTMISGVLDDLDAAASRDEKANTGALAIRLGDIAPGRCGKALLYHVAFLETVNGKPVESDAEKTLAAVKARGFGLLDDTIKYWHDYNASTTALDAPGPWGVRAADFVDDVKMLVQVQQFERTGAVGPMWFFSDQWIRDACGPVKSFVRTGRFDSARRVLDYHYRASAACRKILNWLPMDVDIAQARPPVEDWSKVTMNFADRHATCEVPSWIVLQHYWYFRASGDARTIGEHWGYLKRCFYGQFDNPADKVFRPDFKIPFHGDETYIYSGGEALWKDRYDLEQSSYPGGNIYSADSSFELAAAGDALAAMAKALGKNEDAVKIAEAAAKIRAAAEKYYWMNDLGFYAQGMSVLFDGQLSRYPMANINANVIWSGYGDVRDKKTVSNALRMAEYLMEESGVLNPILGYDVTVGMLQGQGLHTLAAIDHPWAEKAFYALLMIAGETTEFSEWMAPGRDFRTMYRANRIRPWEAGINLDALLSYLSGFEPDAFAKRMVLAPRLPGGVYSPIKWDRMTLRHLPMGEGHFDLSVADTGQGQDRRRLYEVTSHSQDDVTVRLKATVPFATIGRVEVNGKAVDAQVAEAFSQALASITAALPAGRTLAVSVAYRARPAKPVEIDLKPFTATAPKFEKSDIVVFTASRPQPDRVLLREALARKHKVVAIDATLPTDPATFEAALLSTFGLRTRMLILDEGTMASGVRKDTFWLDPRFDEIVGKFLSRGGVVVEAASRNPSSRWLAKTLAPAAFQVDYGRGGDVLAMDAPDAKLDDRFSWLDEKQAEACGKWSGYWAGNYTMKYLGGATLITDRALIWGEQEQPHGCMQYAMKTTTGKDHLVRLRTWPRPKKGFTLQVTEDGGKTWQTIETLWVPIPQDPKENGWLDVYMTLPGKYVTGPTTLFRIGAPKGSQGGIGVPGYASTGAARIWIRDSLEKTPLMAEIATASPAARALGLPDKGVVGYSGGRIAPAGFAAPYRILGESSKAALVLRPVGRGLYVKSELTSLFPVESMTRFVEALLDPAARKEALSCGRPWDGGDRR